MKIRNIIISTYLFFSTTVAFPADDEKDKAEDFSSINLSGTFATTAKEPDFEVTGSNKSAGVGAFKYLSLIDKNETSLDIIVSEKQTIKGTSTKDFGYALFNPFLSGFTIAGYHREAIKKDGWKEYIPSVLWTSLWFIDFSLNVTEFSKELSLIKNSNISNDITENCFISTLFAGPSFLAVMTGSSDNSLRIFFNVGVGMKIVAGDIFNKTTIRKELFETTRRFYPGLLAGVNIVFNRVKIQADAIVYEGPTFSGLTHGNINIYITAISPIFQWRPK